MWRGEDIADIVSEASDIYASLGIAVCPELARVLRRPQVSVSALVCTEVPHSSARLPGYAGRPRFPRNSVSGVLVIAGCGSSSKPSSPSKSASKLAAAAVRFASCMRSHGVPNFPDPATSGGGVHISIKSSSGINPASPAFQAAQKACGKLLPGGAPVSGQPSAAAEAQMLAISECMRAHGVSGFPDPTTTPPSSPAGYSGVLTRNGVSLAIPTTIDLQSPGVQRAATACHLGGLGQGG